MRKILFAMLALAGLVACGNNSPKAVAETAQRDGVEVLCFHGAKRCATCIAVEKGAKEVVETDFAGQIKDGEVNFRIIDITKPENVALADKYEITWSAILVIKRQDGKETITDLTKFAFANARTNPDKFKAELKAEIAKLLKE